MKVLSILALAMVILSAACQTADQTLIVVVTVSSTNNSTSILSASLTKWLEATGAIVYPVNAYDSDAILNDALFNADGVVIYVDPADLTNPYNANADLTKVVAKVVNTLLVDWNAPYTPINVPLLVLGDADLNVLQALGVHGVEYFNGNFTFQQITPYFSNMDFVKTSILSSLTENTQTRAQSGKNVLLNNNWLIPVDIFQETPLLANQFAVTSTGIINGDRYVLSMAHRNYPIDFIKFRPDLLTYAATLANANIQTDANSLRLSQLIAEAFYEAASFVDGDISDLYSNFTLLGNVSTLSNGQYYYTFSNKTEPTPPQQ